MKITEKINLFVEHIPYKKGGESKTYYKITTSIATKQEDGSFLRKSVSVILNAKKFPDAKLAKLNPEMMYTADIINGWHIVDSYTTKDGRDVKDLAIYIDDMKLTGKTAIDQEKRKKALESAKGAKTEEEDDLPF